MNDRREDRRGSREAEPVAGNRSKVPVAIRKISVDWSVARGSTMYERRQKNSPTHQKNTVFTKDTDRRKSQTPINKLIIYDFEFATRRNRFYTLCLHVIHSFTQSRWLARVSATALEPSPKHVSKVFLHNRRELRRIAVYFECTAERINGFEHLSEYILYMYNLLYTIFVLPKTSV